MAENEPLTPEKQLLKLIENPKQAAVRVENVKREGKKLFSFSALKGRLAFWKGVSAQPLFVMKKFGKGSYGIRQINMLLWFFLIVVGGYAAYSIWGMALGVERASRLILSPDKTVAKQGEIGFELKSVDYYLDKIRGRNVFSAEQPEKKEEPKAISEGTVKLEEPPEETKSYSLVGIAWSDSPEAMIEDSDSKKTFFVKRGQVLQNNIKVVAVLKDKVVLSQNGAEFELS